MDKAPNSLPEIVISLTSFPARIDLMQNTLDSICNQSLKADKIVLWLAEEQFPDKEKNLPDFFADYYQFNFEVRWCKEDIRPHKKYYYAFKAFPEALIIVVDDDLIYEKGMVETLVASWKVYPYAVSAMRTHLITKNEKGEIEPYRRWLNEFSGVIGIPSMQLFSTSGAGTLYPPGCMDDEVFNIDCIKEYCLNADDIWLKIMQVKKGTPVVLAKNFVKLIEVDGTQEIALCKVNVDQRVNDVQLNNLLSLYNKNSEFEKLIFEDNFNENTFINRFDLIKENLIIDCKNTCNNTYINQLESDIKGYIQLCEKYKAEIRKLNRQKNRFKRDLSDYPRLIKKGIQSIKNNGLFYTIKLFIER